MIYGKNTARHSIWLTFRRGPISFNMARTVHKVRIHYFAILYIANTIHTAIRRTHIIQFLATHIFTKIRRTGKIMTSTRLFVTTAIGWHITRRLINDTQSITGIPVITRHTFTVCTIIIIPRVTRTDFYRAYICMFTRLIERHNKIHIQTAQNIRFILSFILCIVGRAPHGKLYIIYIMRLRSLVPRQANSTRNKYKKSQPDTKLFPTSPHDILQQIGITKPNIHNPEWFLLGNTNI